MAKQRPIIFSTDMVNAIIKGNKTQTRRIVKPQPKNVEIIAGRQVWDPEVLKCPYGKPGDLLWVREFYKPINFEEDEQVTVQFRDGSTRSFYPSDDQQEKWVERYEKLIYKLDKKGKLICNNETERFEWDIKDVPWTPSIHMPKDAARIWLRVTDVRVERLNSISEEDAVKEGVKKHSDYGSTGFVDYLRPDEALPDVDAIESFETLWQKINGKASWEANPWVWVVTFEMIREEARHA